MANKIWQQDSYWESYFASESLRKKDVETELKNLIKSLRRKSSLERKKIGNDTTHFEGVQKGLYLAYELAANDVDKLLKRYLEDKITLK